MEDSDEHGGDEAVADILTYKAYDLFKTKVITLWDTPRVPSPIVYTAASG